MYFIQVIERYSNCGAGILLSADGLSGKESRRSGSGGMAMLLADDWNDYELIDAGGGEKLERWGRYILGGDPRRSGLSPETGRHGRPSMPIITGAAAEAAGGNISRNCRRNGR